LPPFLADEPTGNLDPENRDLALAFLEEQHRAGRTVVLVTHDPAVARRATRGLRLVGAEVVAETTPGRTAPAA
jgi:ABC-type lipoprotein export system ATPase subunit